MEHEAEIVTGYATEYSGMRWGLFAIGEYANIILMSMLNVLLFMGGWLPPFPLVLFNWIPGSFWVAIKLCFVLFTFIWVRAAYPRYRYDQLMRLGWKVFLPLSLGWVFFVSSLLISMDWLPYQ